MLTAGAIILMVTFNSPVGGVVTGPIAQDPTSPQMCERLRSAYQHNADIKPELRKLDPVYWCFDATAGE